MELTKGIDTITGLVGNPPNSIQIPKKILKEGTSLLREWNTYYLAFLPYCFKCREPVDWAQNQEGVVFICPKCDRKWVLENEQEQESQD